MTCGACGSDTVKCVKSQGGVRSGQFTEKYVCRHCGASGIVSGDASDHATWEYSGDVFAGVES